MKKELTTLISLAIMLATWQIIALCVDQPEFFPSLARLLITLIQMVSETTFYLSVGATLLRGLAGMGLSLLTAFLFAVLFTRVRWLYELFCPVLTLMRSVPVISFILIALIFLHPESIPLLIGFLTMFPLLTENLTQGINHFNPELSVMGKQFGLNRLNRFYHIFYPQLKPFLYSGLASATGFGWRAIIMGEVLSQCAFGIGSEMKKAQAFIAVPELLVWTGIAIGIGFFSNELIQWLSKYKAKITYTRRRKKSPAESITGLPVKAHDLSYSYGISAFNYSFEAGQVYGISAPSGTGKTTLLNLINGTLTPTTGFLEIDRSHGIANLFQEPRLLPHLSATDNVALPLSSSFPKEQAQSIARSLLSELAFDNYHITKLPHELSYGQQQRVALARALAYPAPLLLMDEPFKGLDKTLTTHIIKLLRLRQKQKQQTVLFTSHQPEELSLLADKAIYLD